MKTTLKIIREHSLGWLGFCKDCALFQLLFNNIMISLDSEGMNKFAKFLKSIDVTYWTSECCCEQLSKPIPIPTLQDNLILLLDEQELQALKYLVYGYEHTHFVNASDINYQLSAN